MGRTFFQKLAITFSIGVALVYGAVYACGGGDWYWAWEDQTNFTPETFVDPKFNSYFLSQDLFYNGDGLGDGLTRFDEENTDDWSDYLNGKVDNETLHYFLTDSGTIALAEVYKHIFEKRPSKISQKWSGKMDFKDKKVKNFIDFLHHAKPIETYSNERESWDYEEAEQKRLEDISFIKTLEKKYESISDPFLKNRYWFQVMKGYFYSKKRENGITFFEKTGQLQPKNTLYYRALSYVAGITGRAGNRAKSNYLYSQVFDKCPKLQTVALFCFTPKEEKDWNDAFNYAKNADEKVALWAIQGYYTDEEKAIENIFELNPKSEYLEFLLARLINSEEIKINTSFDKQTVKQNKLAIKDSISKTVVALIDKIAQSNKTPKPYLWNSAAGYLQTLNGNFAKADDYFSKAESEMPKTELAINQLRLLRFINNLSKMDEINPKNEGTVLADLNWLYFELPKKEPENFRYMNASNWSKNYIAALYRSQKNPVMSELFVRDNKFYHETTRILVMKAFLEKEKKSAFEEMAQNIYSIKLGHINDYQAVMATFRNKIPEAIAFMEKSDFSNEEFFGNPFNGNIMDCHDCDFGARQKRKYSKIDFLKTIKTMQDNLTKNEDVYTNALLLGNGFYNITHYGNGRTFHESDILGYGTCPNDFDEKYRNIITNCSVAKMYYQKALAAATTDEQKAKMNYMLAKCERNEYYNLSYSSDAGCWSIQDDEVNFLAWNGFRELKNNYSKTKFYQDAINECGYFRTYIEKNK